MQVLVIFCFGSGVLIYYLILTNKQTYLNNVYKILDFVKLAALNLKTQELQGCEQV